MCAVLLGLLGSPSRLECHPISITTVFLNAKEEKLTVEISVMVEDMILYYFLKSNEEFRYPEEEIKEKATLHADFLLRYLHLRDGDGNRLEGKLVDIEFPEFDENGIHINFLMAHMITYLFEFPIEQQPEFLTVLQTFGGDDPIVPAEMTVRFFHHGVLLESVALSHSTPHTVRLDWDAGWEDAQDDMEAVRQRLKERQQETLGIASYSTVYSYLYITDTEVRHEILIPLLTLETWLPMPREDAETMTIAEQEAVRDSIAAFLKEHQSVEINSRSVEPELDRLDFFGPGARDFAALPEARDVSVFNARVGIITSFPTPLPPRQVRMTWNYYDYSLPFLVTTLYAFDEPREEVTQLPFRKTFEWQGDDDRQPVVMLAIDHTPEPLPRMHLPVLSIVCVGMALICAAGAFRTGSRRSRTARGALAAALTITAVALLPFARVSIAHPFTRPPTVAEDTARQLFQKLHRNIYHAFELRDEERIYDALDQSVAGPLLEDLYLNVRRNLTLREQGGALSRVREVELLGGEIGPLSHSSQADHGFAYECTWTVTGTVEHWGHIHTRKNKYRARFEVEALPSGWKITDFQPLSEERIEMQIELRR